MRIKVLISIIISFSLTLAFFTYFLSKESGELTRERIVLSNSEYQNYFNLCEKRENQELIYQCYLTYFQNLSVTSSPVNVVKTFVTLKDKTNAYSGRCHSIGHRLGKWLFDEYGSKAIDSIVDVCGLSITHGYMERAGLTLPLDEFELIFLELCKNENNISGCVHGLGHGLYLTNIKIDQADNFCTEINSKFKLEDKSHPNMYNVLCMEGYVMEDFLGSIEEWKKAREIKYPLSLCEGLSTYSKIGCEGIALRNYIQISSAFKDLNKYLDNRIKEVVGRCKFKVNEEKFYCSGYIGYSLSELVDVKNLDIYEDKRISISCSLVFAKSCLDSYFGSIFSLIGKNTPQMKVYCSKFRGDDKKYCINSYSTNRRI